MQVDPSPPQFHNLLGAGIAVGDNLLVITVLLARLAGKPRLEYGLGVTLLCTALPLGYLLLTSFSQDRSTLYRIQLGWMILFLVVELLLDYIFEFDFRHTRWMAITYVMMFFSAFGGMIGVAAQAGRMWTWSAVISFWIMFAVAFYQRAKTGM